MTIPLHRSILVDLHIFYTNKIKIILHALLHYFFCCTISAHFALCTLYINTEEKNGQMNGERGPMPTEPEIPYNCLSCRLKPQRYIMLPR